MIDFINNFLISSSQYTVWVKKETLIILKAKTFTTVIYNNIFWDSSGFLISMVYQMQYKCTEIFYVQNQIGRIQWVASYQAGSLFRWDDNSWQKSVFSATDIGKSFVWSVGS